MSGRRSITLASALLAAVFVGLLAYGLLRGGQSDALRRAVADGRKPRAPAFDLAAFARVGAGASRFDARLLSDSRIALSEYHGRRILINIWASWCVPCKQEARVLTAGSIAYRGRVSFLGVNVRDGNRDARAFLRRYDVTYPNADDPSDVLWGSYELTGVPESFLIDERGRVLVHEQGPFTASSLDEAITRAFGLRTEAG